MVSVKGFFSVASLASLLPFAPVCLSSVSGPCPYPFCLCLPFIPPFPVVPHIPAAIQRMRIDYSWSWMN